jgi:hypothetical protein
MISMDPENIPAPPRPEIARPKIKATEFGAAPQTTDPTSKTAMAIRYTHLIE